MTYRSLNHCEELRHVNKEIYAHTESKPPYCCQHKTARVGTQLASERGRGLEQLDNFLGIRLER